MMIIKDHYGWKPCKHGYGCRLRHNSARIYRIGEDEQHYDHYNVGDDDNDDDDNDDNV